MRIRARGICQLADKPLTHGEEYEVPPGLEKAAFMLSAQGRVDVLDSTPTKPSESVDPLAYKVDTSGLGPARRGRPPEMTCDLCGLVYSKHVMKRGFGDPNLPCKKLARFFVSKDMPPAWHRPDEWSESAKRQSEPKRVPRK